MNRQEAISTIRNALRAIPTVAQSSATEQPDINQLVTPRTHARALDPREMVVEGDRGVGKSFWSSVLTHEPARIEASKAYPSLKLDRVAVSLGFAQARQEDYPSAATLKALTKAAPTTVWRLVALRAAARAVKAELPPDLAFGNRWGEAAAALEADPEREEELFSRINSELQRSGRRLLLIFDALDRIGGRDWHAVRRLVRSILESGLDIRDS